MNNKTLRDVRADIETGGRNGDLCTGNVQLRGIPEWMKDSRFITATLTPAQARHLALELLQAAERAEGGQ